MDRRRQLLVLLVAVATVRGVSPDSWGPAPRSRVPELWQGPTRVPELCFAGHSGLSGCERAANGNVCRRSPPTRPASTAPRTWRSVLQAEAVAAGESGASEDELGALLRTWGVEDARAVLEANGFTTVQRVRDVMEADDLPELGLPLATRKILARLIKHLADEKRDEKEAALSRKVASLIDSGVGADSESTNDAEAKIAAAADLIRDDALYNSDATKTKRRWQPFHRVISEKISDGAGNFALRAIEEIELDAPVNEEALNTSLVPMSDDEDDLPDTVALSGGRGGRYEATRKRVLAPPPQLEPGQKQKRHFRYRSREGDFFVKVVLTGDPVDERGDDEKEDAAGDMLAMFMGGDLESSDSADFGADMDALIKGLDLSGSGGGLDLSGGSRGWDLGGVGRGGGGLILDIPDDLKAQLFGEDGVSVKGLKYPHNLYEGEQVSLSSLRSTGQMRMPAPIVAGDLLDDDGVKNHLEAGFEVSDLFSGGYGVLEWVELKRDINPNIVSDVAQQLARVHLSTVGMSKDYGFSINTFLGEIEQDNTLQRGVDVLDFFTTRRLEPMIDAASRSSTERAVGIPAKLRDEIGTKGFKVDSFPCRSALSQMLLLENLRYAS